MQFSPPQQPGLIPPGGGAMGAPNPNAAVSIAMPEDDGR